MPYYGYYFDATYLLVIIGAVICLIASAKLKSTYAKYARVSAMSGMTGAQAAERILHFSGIYDVRIEHIAGDLTDHYDPTNRVLRLSDTTYNAHSVAAIGVAAHECGHAVQHARNYVPLTIRKSMVPVVNLGSNLSWPMILLGIVLGNNSFLIHLGIVLFSLAVLFQLVTLPVEWNASGRALVLLRDTGILYEDEVKSARKVLSAAALTYVAGTASAILQLLRLVLLFGGRGRNDD